MDFANAVTIINESYKKPETLQPAMDFLDAITILQNTWKRNKSDIINKRCKRCLTYIKDNYTSDQLEKHMISEVDRCNECGCVICFMCYCCD